ncbi:MAG: hypothetical protein FWG74_07225 [Planctomycetes bacterium]|nr:hypothetical protein [Planctomycetota bacterium]
MFKTQLTLKAIPQGIWFHSSKREGRLSFELLWPAKFVLWWLPEAFEGGGARQCEDGSGMEKQRLNMADIMPGMKLAEPVTNRAGITLMPAGIKLTPLFINRLQKWKVEALDVFVEKESRPPSLADRQQNNPESVPRTGLTAEQNDFSRQIAAEISGRFANVQDNPLMLELQKAATKLLIAYGSDSPINSMFRPESAAQAETEN